jgi:hypothetical protein
MKAGKKGSLPSYQPPCFGGTLSAMIKFSKFLAVLVL